MRVKFGVLEQIQGLQLHAEIHLNVFIVSASDGQKKHNFGQPPFTDEGQIWCAIADPRPTPTGQISSEYVHCVGFR